MRQSVLRTDTQPLGTGRQPLNAVGRLILLSPKRAMRQSVLRTDTQPLGTGRHLLAQMDVILFPCVPHNSTSSKDWVGRYKHLPIYWLSALSALSAFTHASQIAEGAGSPASRFQRKRRQGYALPTQSFEGVEKKNKRLTQSQSL